MQINAAATAQLAWWEDNHDIGQDSNLHAGEPGEQDRNFDVVRVKYINIHSIKFIIFTKLGSSASQIWTLIVYKVDTEANGNLMPLKIF